MVNKPPLFINARPAKQAFQDAGGEAFDYNLKIKANIGLLICSLKKYETKASVNTPEAEIDIQKKFREFLIGCEFHMAILDFNDLLQESDKKPRNDGSTAWHHQFSQLLLFLSQVQSGVISLDNLEEYGGLETVIRTELRHDSIEDFSPSFKDFEAKQTQTAEDQHIKLSQQGIYGIDNNWLQTQYQRLEILMSNLRLITKKIAQLDKDGNLQYDDNGKIVKKNLFKNTIEYAQKMLRSKIASPIVFILKSYDGSHNLSTMLGAPKFIAMKRKKYANEREDMYGSRHGLPEAATKKWPIFANAIQEADSLMGAVLYINLGYLSHVDQEDAYPRNPKYNDGETIYELGIGKYLEKALKYSIPRAFNPLHILLDSIQNIAEFSDNEITKTRAQLFIDHALKPALKPHAQHFPSFFSAVNDNNERQPPPSQSPS